MFYLVWLFLPGLFSNTILSHQLFPKTNNLNNKMLKLIKLVPDSSVCNRVRLKVGLQIKSVVFFVVWTLASDQ